MRSNLSVQKWETYKYPNIHFIIKKTSKCIAVPSADHSQEGFYTEEDSSDLMEPSTFQSEIQETQSDRCPLCPEKKEEKKKVFMFLSTEKN